MAKRAEQLKVWIVELEKRDAERAEKARKKEETEYWLHRPAGLKQ